jgi:ATPase subunit of ABC transporter with duplicated ATPase domains
VLFSDPEIMLLDEPTNHLDISTITWLEQYLINNFKGVLAVISHDRSFVNNLSTHILDIDYGEIREYTGSYDSFFQQKQQVITFMI